MFPILMQTIQRDSAICFPMLGNLTINPPSYFTLFGKNIYFYGVVIGLGFILGMLYCARRSREFGLKPDDVYDLMIWLIPFSIVGARLYYVLFNLETYLQHPSQIFAIREGGLAIYGGIIAGILVIWAVCRKKKVPVAAFLDLVVFGLLVGQIIGRWGNFMNREAFGAATELPWRMRLWTSATTYMDVHPTFLYESLWNVIGLLLLYFVVSRARRFDGENTCFYFIWYGLGRFWIEGLRTDSLYLFHWTLFGQRIRVSQALSLVMVLVCAGILVYQFKVKKADGSNLFVKRVQQTTEAEEAAAEPTAPDEKQ